MLCSCDDEAPKIKAFKRAHPTPRDLPHAPVLDLSLLLALIFGLFCLDIAIIMIEEVFSMLKGRRQAFRGLVLRPVPWSSKPLPKTTATILDLPLELRQAMLAQCDSVRTLWAASAAAHCFHDALQGTTASLIVQEVLFRVIPESLAPEVLTRLKYAEASALAPKRKLLHTLLDDYFGLLKTGVSYSWTLREAILAENFHDLVRAMAADFVSKALAYHPETGAAVGPSDVVSPSSLELSRIYRAFYTFELYTAVVRSQRKAPLSLTFALGGLPKEQCDVFLRRFAPWETEQPACIHDFLLEEVSQRRLSTWNIYF
jgi:hypothetical protein